MPRELKGAIENGVFRTELTHSLTHSHCTVFIRLFDRLLLTISDYESGGWGFESLRVRQTSNTADYRTSLTAPHDELPLRSTYTKQPVSALFAGREPMTLRLRAKRAHRLHTSTVEINIYWGFERVLLIRSLSARLSRPAFGESWRVAFPRSPRPDTLSQRPSSKSASAATRRYSIASG